MSRDPLTGPIPPRSLRINMTAVNMCTPAAVADHVFWTVEQCRRGHYLGVAVDQVGGFGGGIDTLTWTATPPSGWYAVGGTDTEWTARPVDVYQRLLDRGVPRSALRLSPDCHTLTSPARGSRR